MYNTPAALQPWLALANEILDASEATARLAAKTYHRATRKSRGGTVRPGPDTPLWNELAAEARRLIRKHGEKANLGRFLGLPRQRVHEFLMEKSAGPDAERTLRLLIWVSAKRRGITLG
jgi:hypothetical protein